MRESPNWFLDGWEHARDEGLVPYILVTAPRLQLSKTACTMTLSEDIMEKVEGRKWDIDRGMSFEIPEFMEKWQLRGEYEPGILDEPNRPAGARKWHSPGNLALAEWVQTRAYEHRPSWFPLPHQALLDNAICDVCTSHAVVSARGFVTFYELDPDMLNRKRQKVWTPRMGTIEYRKPHPENWAEYLKRRIAYNSTRGPMLIAQAKGAEAKAQLPTFSHNDIVSVILSNPSDFTVKGRLSPTRAANMIPGISYGAAQLACDDVNRLLSLRAKAESQT